MELFAAPANAIPLGDGTVDVVFTSNFLEHLHHKAECDQVFAEVKRILAPGGTFIIIGPNIRYLADRYWDFYDHHLPLSHLSLEEGLIQAGYRVELIIPKFLPYTAKSAIPKHPSLVALYLEVPLALVQLRLVEALGYPITLQDWLTLPSCLASSNRPILALMNFS